MTIVWVILVALVILFIVTFVYAGIRGAPWLPTMKSDIERVMEFSGMKEGDMFVELGSGDGRIICKAAERGVKSIGYEMSLFPYVISKIRYLFSKSKKNITFKYGDFWKADLSEADFVYVFLTPATNKKASEKLKRDLKKGAHVIGYVWDLEGLDLKRVDEIEGKLKLYLYEI